jgi:hypothetical protein
MDTQQIVQTLNVEEPFRLSLKAERVQQPELAALGAGVPMSSAFELTINQKQPVTIELPALQVVITLHGTTAGNDAADVADTADAAGPQGLAG